MGKQVPCTHLQGKRNKSNVNVVDRGCKTVWRLGKHTFDTKEQNVNVLISPLPPIPPNACLPSSLRWYFENSAYVPSTTQLDSLVSEAGIIGSLVTEGPHPPFFTFTGEA